MSVPDATDFLVMVISCDSSDSKALMVPIYVTWNKVFKFGLLQELDYSGGENGLCLLESILSVGEEYSALNSSPTAGMCAILFGIRLVTEMSFLVRSLNFCIRSIETFTG
jgi:hypothetical protein